MDARWWPGKILYNTSSYHVHFQGATNPFEEDVTGNYANKISWYPTVGLAVDDVWCASPVVYQGVVVVGPGCEGGRNRERKRGSKTDRQTEK